MRRRFLLAGFALLTLLAVLGLQTPALALPSGDVCFSALATNEDGLTKKVVVRMHLKALDAYVGIATGYVNVGDGLLILSGEYFMAPTSPTSTAKSVYVNLSATQKHSDGGRDSRVMQVVFSGTNVTTLKSGTFFATGINFKSSSLTFSERSVYGTMTKITCP